MIGNGLFINEGEFWLRQRRLMQPAFHRQRIEAFGDLVTGATLSTLERWEPAVEAGRPLDVAIEMTQLIGLVQEEVSTMHYLLFYEVGEDYLERRAALREEHLILAWEACARGELVLGGALADPVDGAILLFRGESPAVAEQFAASDPYVRHGLVKSWRVRPWTTVVGEEAATPVRPAAGY